MRMKMINSCSSKQDQLETYKITKTEIKNFASIVKKKKVRMGDKVTEMKIQKDLFGRLLGISVEKKIDIAKVCFLHKYYRKV